MYLKKIRLPSYTQAEVLLLSVQSDINFNFEVSAFFVLTFLFFKPGEMIGVILPLLLLPSVFTANSLAGDMIYPNEVWEGPSGVDFDFDPQVPSIRDAGEGGQDGEYLQHSSLWGHKYIEGQQEVVSVFQSLLNQTYCRRSRQRATIFDPRWNHSE